MNMDELDDLQASEFVTDNEDQDSLDERIDTEQRLRNQQLWTSFQNAASCITELYKDRARPSVTPWAPFQHAASNLTTLYKDCIESQRRFARIGYQAGRRKKYRELQRLLKKQQRTSPSKQQQLHPASSFTAAPANVSGAEGLLQNNFASILAVNQINLDCDESPMQAQDSSQTHFGQQQQHQQQQSPHRQPSQHLFQQLPQQPHQLTQSPQQQQNNNNNLQILLSNNDDDLLTFQSALAQPTSIRGIKSSQNKRTSTSNNSGYAAGRPFVDHGSEDERRLELTQFLTEEYHRHVGSKKRSCSSLGGSHIKRLRD